MVNIPLARRFWSSWPSSILRPSRTAPIIILHLFDSTAYTRRMLIVPPCLSPPWAGNLRRPLNMEIAFSLQMLATKASPQTDLRYSTMYLSAALQKSRRMLHQRLMIHCIYIKKLHECAQLLVRHISHFYKIILDFIAKEILKLLRPRCLHQNNTRSASQFRSISNEIYFHQQCITINIMMHF
jgi:hypothetical protein